MKRVEECERHARIECLLAAGAWQSEHIRRSVFMVRTLGALERKAGKIEVITWLSAGDIYSNVSHFVFWLYLRIHFGCRCLEECGR
jgi:hypothetical protein